MKMQNFSYKELAVLAGFFVFLTWITLFVFFEGYIIYLNLVIESCRVETIYCNSPIDNLPMF